MYNERVNEFEVCFELQGKGFDPNEITKILNIKPTSIQKEKAGTYSTSHWILSSGLEKGIEVDIGIAAEKLIE